MIVPPNYQRDDDLWRAAWATHGSHGTGSASTLPMTSDEKKKRRPIGFAPPPAQKEGRA